jgi:hypothetical protein
VKHEIVVVSSCTATKTYTPDGKFKTAESLYIGQQHLRLMRGVQNYRDAKHPAGRLHLRILSAHHGLIAPSRKIASYDHTFSGLPVNVVRRQAVERGVPEAMRRLLARRFSVGILLLSDPYLRACDLDQDVVLGGSVISLCSRASARRLPQLDALRTIPLTNEHARQFSCGLVALKGELAGRILTRLAEEPEELTSLVQPGASVLNWLAVASNVSDRVAA